MDNITIEKEFAGRRLKLEVNKIATQSKGSVVVSYGETVILVTVCVGETEIQNNEVDVLPLIVDYRERTYAAGRIPGGFFKREGKPREKEILVSRLIDRSLRPLIQKDYNKDIHVTATVLSSDEENDTDFPAIIGAGVAVLVAGIPIKSYLGAIRVGYTKNNEFILNPTLSQMDNLLLDVTVAGTEDDILMIEGGGKEVEEDILIKALEIGRGAIEEFVSTIKPYLEKHIILESQENEEIPNPSIEEFVTPYKDELLSAFFVKRKKEREEKLKSIMDKISNVFITQYPESELKNLKLAVNKLLRTSLRNSILQNGLRIDGRKPEDIRDISCEVSILPRTHGSALFTRGETQALVTVTLGTPEDMQIMDELTGEYKERFLFHYNFPGFSTGEVRPDRSPSRREIGHGMLAKRALYPLLPEEDKFPYTIRVVSDILESNGSSSMASVCGGALALMDAGVPITSLAAGVAMGLVKENDKYIILTDIQGTEDHYGDMDFKIGGTSKGITALQMDVKTQNISLDIISEVIYRAREARLRIIDIMNKIISSPRKEVSRYAPQIAIFPIPVSKIRDVIGFGGKIIKKIQSDTGTIINIEENGKAYISGKDKESVELAKELIKQCITDVEVGRVYKGRITRIADFGVFVEILCSREGLIHISQLPKVNLHREFKENQEILVKVVDMDPYGRISLRMVRKL
jgi:polyribonucleotide nucleotidyltransferase